MKIWLKLSMATLLLAALVAPSIAQDSKAEERTFLVKEKHEKGVKVREEHEESQETKVALEDGTVVETTTKTETETQVTEILAVSAEGKVSQGRVSWPKGTQVVEVVKLGEEPADPVEMDIERKGASILYTFNAETKKWEAKLEKGDEELDDVKKALKKAEPFANPFIPGREVKLGESWDADKDILKTMFASDESIELKEATGTCKAEEVVKEGELELLRISFEMKISGKLKDENIGTPDLAGVNKGSIFWNCKEGRAERIEMENSAEFVATVQHPQLGALKLTITISGSASAKFSYGKVGDKEEEKEEKDEKEEDGMDG